MKKQAPEPGGFKTEEMLKEEAKRRREEQARIAAAAPPPPPSKKKAENYWYHYKWHTIAGVVALVLVAFLLRDVVFRTNPDFTVVVTTTTYLSAETQDALQQALEQAAFDRNGDGKTLVSIDYIYLSSQASSELGMETGDDQDPAIGVAGGESDYATVMKLTTVVAAGADPIYLVDRDMYRYFARMANPSDEFDEEGNPLPVQEEILDAAENIFEPLPFREGQDDQLPFSATILSDAPGCEALADSFFVIRLSSSRKDQEYHADCMAYLRVLAGE